MRKTKNLKLLVVCIDFELFALNVFVTIQINFVTILLLHDAKLKLFLLNQTSKYSDIFVIKLDSRFVKINWN